MPGLDLELAPARGGKRVAAPLGIELVRQLDEGDLAELRSPSPVGSRPPPLAAVRHQHHQLAQALAQGMEHIDAGLISGFSIAYISILQNDPTFQELLAHYTAQRELAYVDVLARMKALGLSTLEELQARLMEKPDGFGNRELLEMADLMLVRGRKEAGGGAAASASAPPTIQIKFVTPSAPGSGVVVDAVAEPME